MPLNAILLQVLGPQVNELAAALRSSVAEALEDSTLVCDVPQAPDTSKLRQVEQEMKQLVTLQKQLESMQQVGVLCCPVQTTLPA